jgi:hypothetical protein
MKSSIRAAVLGFLGISSAFSGSILRSFADDSGITTNASTALGVANGPQPDAGFPVGPFLVYPQFTVGTVYNDNVFATALSKTGSLGLQLAPSLVAVDDQGLHKTTLTFDGQLNYYPGAKPAAGSGGLAEQSTQVSVNVKLDHVWNPTPDVTIDTWGGYQRQDSIFGATGSGPSSFVSSSSSLSVASFQQYSDLIFAGVSVEKKFTDQFFVRGGIGAQDLYYEAPPVGAVSQLSGVEGNGFVRVGDWIIPVVNVFIETGVDAERYDQSLYNTNAYRVIGGLSSDLIGLFRGEVFAGYQEQFSARGAFDPVSAPTYGGKLYYYPTKYLTLAASVNQTFGSDATPVLNGPALNPGSTQTLQARFEADYAMAEYWSATARAGWAQTTLSNSPVVDTAWTIGAGISYNFWRNIGLTANYQYLKIDTNTTVTPGYIQNIVSAGLTYRY